MHWLFIQTLKVEELCDLLVGESALMSYSTNFTNMIKLIFNKAEIVIARAFFPCESTPEAKNKRIRGNCTKNKYLHL